MNNEQIREILIKRIDHQKQSLGIAAGIIDQNGRSTIAHPATIDENTIFEIGSVTKVFTSLLLADMVNRSELSLDDPAAKFLPAHVTLPERNGKSITLRDLSQHTSALPRLPGNLKPNDPQNPYASYTVEDLNQFLETCQLPRDPGTEVEYSNLGAGLLGHILALRAGTDYETLLRMRITEPLSMPDTRITLTNDMQRRMTTGHNATLTPVPNWDLPTLAGAGALRSSANDMLTFLEAFLGLKETPLAPAMQTMHDTRRPTGKPPFEIGLGWSIVGDIACHDGGTGGFCSFVAYDRKTRAGVVVLSNAFTLTGVADLGMHLLNPNSPLTEPRKQPSTAIHLNPELLDRYTGRYQWGERILEITRDNDRLFIQTFTETITGPKFEMFAESEKKFLVQITNSQITFETGANGKANRATSLTIHRPGREPDPAPRI